MRLNIELSNWIIMLHPPEHGTNIKVNKRTLMNFYLYFLSPLRHFDRTSTTTITLQKYYNVLVSFSLIYFKDHFVEGPK
jgi:hypothetical protein